MKRTKSSPASRRAGRPVVACAARLRALADATRLHVVRELMRGARGVGELQFALNVEQSLLSHHLSVLRAADVVVSERAGKGVLYRLAPGIAGTPKMQALNLGCCVLSFPVPAGPAIRSNSKFL